MTFVGNRLLAAREREAMFLLEEGAPPEDVDRVMRAFGFPIGPFELRDLAGVDVAWRNRQGRLSRLNERERRCDWVDKLYAADRLGQKAGVGFYRYAPGSRQGRAGPLVDRGVGPAPAAMAHHAAEHHRSGNRRALFVCTINEAAWLIDNDIGAPWRYRSGVDSWIWLSALQGRVDLPCRPEGAGLWGSADAL